MISLVKFQYSFEKLQVWQDSIVFAKSVYQVANTFPQEEKFGLTSQIKRAVVSVSSNLAEGSAKKSFRDQARFTEIAFGSLMEVLNQLILAVELGFLKKEKLEKLREDIDNLSRQINGLKSSQIKRCEE